MVQTDDSVDVKPPTRVYVPPGWSPESGWLDPRLRHGALLLGRAISEGRRRAGMSQRHLATRSGVDQPTISRLERGLLSGISLRRLAAIFAVLNDIFRV
jgi:DNA-binding XRE family transcriptional regulator